MRERFRFAAVLLLLCAMLGCSGGDDESPTGPNNLCSLPWSGTRSWFMRGGCAGGAASDISGTSPATFNNCTLTMDVTPTLERQRGATWTLTANLQTNSAQVVRVNTDCPATDTGTLRGNTQSLAIDMRAPTNSSCNCTLVYTISIPRPL